MPGFCRRASLAEFAEIRKNLGKREILEGMNGRIVGASDRAWRRRIDGPARGVNPTLGQAQGEDEDLGGSHELAESRKVTNPLRRDFASRMQTERFDGRPQSVEVPAVLLPYRVARCPLAQSFFQELKELPDQVDVAVARRVQAKAEFASLQLGQPRWRRFGVEHVETLLLQVTRDMLREAATGRRDGRREVEHVARRVQIFQLFGAALRDGRLPETSRGSIDVGGDHCAVRPAGGGMLGHPLLVRGAFSAVKSRIACAKLDHQALPQHDGAGLDACRDGEVLLGFVCLPQT